MQGSLQVMVPIPTPYRGLSPLWSAQPEKLDNSNASLFFPYKTTHPHLPLSVNLVSNRSFQSIVFRLSYVLLH